MVDLEDKDSVKRVIAKIRPTVIYHCATYGGYHFQADVEKMVRVNIGGTVNLLEACSEHGFNCFINTGSSSEYGIKNRPMKETDVPEPANSYGASKAAATIFCQQFARKNNLPIVTLRLFSPYGYFDDPRRLFSSVILSLLDGKIPELSSPRSVRDFVFIDDVIKAYVESTIHINKVRGGIVNIGSGKQSSVGETVDLLVRLHGMKSKVGWGVVCNPRVEPSCWVADISKSNRILGWKPNVKLAAGLALTLGWFRANKGLYA